MGAQPEKGASCNFGCRPEKEVVGGSALGGRELAACTEKRREIEEEMAARDEEEVERNAR